MCDNRENLWTPPTIEEGSLVPTWLAEQEPEMLEMIAVLIAYAVICRAENRLTRLGGFRLNAKLRLLTPEEMKAIESSVDEEERAAKERERVAPGEDAPSDNFSIGLTRDQKVETRKSRLATDRLTAFMQKNKAWGNDKRSDLQHWLLEESTSSSETLRFNKNFRELLMPKTRYKIVYHPE